MVDAIRVNALPVTTIVVPPLAGPRDGDTAVVSGRS